MPIRKCIFNKTLQEKYPFIKLRGICPSDVLCEKCSTQFSVSYGGGSDVEQHLRSEKHKNADRAAAASHPLQRYFKNVNTPTSKDLEIAAAEGVWAYHTVQENHSFRSNDSPSTATWASISTDASNHGSQKMFPILVRYFLPYEGVQVKILEFKELFGENSDIIVSYVADVLREHNILSKIVAFCGDNTNCNFGGSERKGKNNVFAKLNQITAIEVAKVINELRANLEEKLSSIFLPYSVRRLLSDLQKKGEVQEDYVKSIASDFYKTTTEYLQQWTSYNHSELQIFKWVDLRKILTWVEVQKSMDVLIEKGLIGSEQDTEAFDEFTLFSSYVSDKAEEWNSDFSNKYAEHRWIEVFQYFRDNNLNHTIFQKIVEYVLCMPATNAPVERIFSLMNNLWTAEKTQLQVSSLKAMLLTKVNFKMSCTEFYSFLKSSPDLLQQICSNEKYTSI
ncbi:hypothetical protein QTP88_009023 [Uroleucon formosanum]